jgi:hypothetical protein
MNFLDYFTKGLGNTLKFKNRANFSFKGEAIPVFTNTVIDTFFIGDFSSANYEIIAEYDKDNVEHLEVKVIAHYSQASVVVYGRSNTGKDLINLSATIDNSKVQIIANPFLDADGITALSGIKVTFKATYSERLKPLQPTALVGETTSLGGQSGTNLNWSGTNLPNGAIQLNDAGSIVVAHISTINTLSQPTLTSKFIFDTLTFAADPSIGVTTSNNNSINFNLNYVKDLNVNNTFTATPVTAGSLNNVIIGGSVAVDARFTNLTAGGNLNISGTGLDIALVPATGLVTIASGLPGSINNMSIGATTPTTGKFTSLTAQTILSLNSNNQNISLTPTGSVQITSGVLGSINNMSVGTGLDYANLPANILRAAVGGLPSPTVNGRLLFDITNDGSVTSADALAMTAYLQNNTQTYAPYITGTLIPALLADPVTFAGFYTSTGYAASGRFTSITINNPSTNGTALITRSKLLSRLLLGAVAI